MTERSLRSPLRRYLDDSVTEAEVHRTWKNVQRRSQLPRRRARYVPTTLALAAAAFLLVVAFWGFPATDVGALVDVSGATPVGWSVPADRSEQVRFSDGSNIQLAAGTRLEVLTNTGSSFVTSLKRGSGAFEVEPGGPRQWVIDCGFATIEVVGTKFRVDRSVDEVRVAVERGTVRVRGEGFEQLIRAGERTAILRPRLRVDEPPAPVADQMGRGAEARAAPPREATDQLAEVPARNAAARQGDEWDALLRQADAARVRGRRERAVELLERVVRECPDPPRRKLAAFTLGRLQLDEDPEAAARTLQGALDAGMTRGLSEDALARLVEAYARAGDGVRAREAAAEYERRYPEGRHLAEVRHWVEGG